MNYFLKAETEAQKKGILNELPQHGWSATSLESVELEWWQDEVWRLESIWSPVGVEAFIAFLVDPSIHHSLTRKKGESVWAVMASPRSRSKEGGYEISLNQGWAERLPDFFEHLDKIRNGGTV